MRGRSPVRSSGYAVVACLLMLAGGGAAKAAIIATMTFTDPAETVGSTDNIPVWLTLTLDPFSDALITDLAGNAYGVTTADITANLLTGLPNGVDGTSATNTNLNVAFGCSGTFTNGCGGPPYDFVFNYPPDSLIAPINLDLEAATSTQFLFGTFMPTGGVTPAGTYTFTYASVFIQVFDNQLHDPNCDSCPLHIADIPIANTLDSGVAFTRTVVDTATPEPSTLLMLGTGLLALGFGAKRKFLS